MGLNLPDGMTEDEFVSIVNNVAGQLCHKFKFGYYEIDDIKQECFIEAIDALNRYDPDRPLVNFLWSHLHNRLCNLKRKKYFRREKPCDNCPLNAYVAETDECTAFEDRLECAPYAVWAKKNDTKKNIMNPIGLSSMNDEQEKNARVDSDMLSNVANNEIISLIDDNISLANRKYWLQQKGGIKIPKKHYDELLNEIHIILEDNNVEVKTREI